MRIAFPAVTDDAWGFEVPVVVVHGTLGDRADRVQSRLALVTGKP